MKEVEFFNMQMIQKILPVMVQIAFLIMEPQGPLFEVFKATPSPLEHVISDTEAKPDLRELKSLESLLLHHAT